jgi:hypothetical protein
MAENVIAVGRFAVVESAAPVQVERILADQAGRKANGTRFVLLLLFFVF